MTIGKSHIKSTLYTIGNPYLDHPRASQALHTRVATCYTHIGVPHVCHTRAHHAPRLAPTVLLLDSSIGLSPLYSGFQKIKISTISIFQPGLGSSRPTRMRGPPAHPSTRPHACVASPSARARARMGGTVVLSRCLRVGSERALVNILYACVQFI